MIDKCTNPGDCCGGKGTKKGGSGTCGCPDKGKGKGNP